jgi:thymidylate kinase
VNTLIFEGIATSGKSTVIKQLQSSLEGKLKIRVAGEDETHEPIMKDRKENHTDFYLDLLGKLTLQHPDLLIIDRFYLTQAFRAKTDLRPYEKVEEALKPFNPITIFLSVEPGTIADRIDKTVQHRGPEWGSHFASIGNSRDEQAVYYIAQQNSQLELLKQSALLYKIFDTTNHKYDGIAKEIVGLIENR